MYLSHVQIAVTIPTVNLVAPNSQIVGQPLTLECSVIAVRGITSRVDIIWSNNDGSELQAFIGTNASLTNNNSEIYTSTYTIPLLSTTDDGRVYQCEVVINTSPTISTRKNFTLDVISKCFFVLLN